MSEKKSERLAALSVLLLAGWWWSEVQRLCCNGGVLMVAKSCTIGSVVQRCSVWRVGDHAVSVVECVLHIGCRD